MAGID